ncbi:MAG: alpha/beta hydrolase [Bdellovibrionales bacterium]|nr:alpha/beta hydrolase [Bdellovibrionales bacterium]
MVETQYKAVGDINIAYEDWQTASPASTKTVLLLHGWGASKELYHSVAAALSGKGNARVIALDFPGFGKSSVPAAVWGVDDFVSAVIGLLEQLDIHRVDMVIGHSHGGRVALKAAVQYPKRFGKLLLIGSAGIPSPPSFKKSLKVRLFKSCRKLVELFVPAGEKRESLLDVLRGYFGSADYRDAGAMRQSLVAVLREDLTPILPQVSQPTLLVWGENDTDSPLRTAKIMEANIPDAGLVVWEGAGHYAFLDKPEHFERVALHFLAGESRVVQEQVG